MMTISVLGYLLMSHVTTSHHCSVADRSYLMKPSCKTHYLSWFYFVCSLCWLMDQRGFMASSGPSYCMTSSWVFLLQQAGQHLPRPYRSPLCIWETKRRGCQRLEGRRHHLAVIMSLMTGWDIISDELEFILLFVQNIFFLILTINEGLH